MTRSYGASVANWSHFANTLGLRADLLPVVSNPNAKISPTSKLHSLGKVPSIYNTQRLVAGIKDWTDLSTTSKLIDRWVGEPDYGICLQTRVVRAFDLDVTDQRECDAIHATISEVLGVALPVRTREDSPKRLLLVRVAGEQPKRVIRVNGGIVELLGNGQQCVVVGTHQSGSRYEWAGGLPSHIPEISAGQLDLLWGTLELAYATSASSTAAISNRSTLNEHNNGDDSVSAFLRRSALFRGDDKSDGRVYFTCPWQSGHSGDSGTTETTYFPRGSNGIDTGSFKCLHASCANRTRDDFLDGTGWFLDGIPIIPTEKKTPVDPNPTVALVIPNADYDLPEPVGGDSPDGTRLDKSGRVLPVLPNCLKFLRAPELIGVDMVYDAFGDTIMLGGGPTRSPWQHCKDEHYIKIRERLESTYHFNSVSTQMVADCVLLISGERRVDTAASWLGGLKWDGIPRIASYMHKYMGALDDEYSQAMSRYIWTGLAGRVLDPGCQLDIVPIWVSKQGTGKTSAVAAMAPDRSCFIEMDLQEADDSLARKLRGKMLVELAELQGLRGRDSEHIKAWITRREENVRPLFREMVRRFLRRCLFIGTTNRRDFLVDETGHRRFAGIEVGVADLAKIVQDRDQLWAEGAALWRESGIQWEKLQTLAHLRNRAYTESDDWCERIRVWLTKVDTIDGDTPGERERLFTVDVAEGALGIRAGNLKLSDGHRIARSMRELGYDKPQVWDEHGKQARYWVKQTVQ